MPMAARAVQPDEILPDAAQEHRARAISRGLRCLVCQNQSIDDSDAPLAKDLRLLVRERIKAGDDDQAVVDFVVARYGDFVLLKPPFKPSTLLLWLSPLVILLGGLWLGREAMTRPARRDNRKPTPLSATLSALNWIAILASNRSGVSSAHRRFARAAYCIAASARFDRANRNRGVGNRFAWRMAHCRRRCRGLGRRDGARQNVRANIDARQLRVRSACRSTAAILMSRRRCRRCGTECAVGAAKSRAMAATSAFGNALWTAHGVARRKFVSGRSAWAAI